MAPSAGSFYHLVARNYKVLRLAAKKASRTLNEAVFARSQPQLQPIFARAAPRQPVHPAAFLRQSKRWHSTGFTSTIRRFATSSGTKTGPRYDRSTFPTSRVSSAVSQSTGRAPFASTLRPNLTGGALGRTAGGYGLGSGRVGGARFFSHSPTATAQVVSNVSQAVRAFMIGGQKAQFDGVNPYTGGKRYKAVSALQDETSRTMSSVPKTSPGSYIDFSVNPTITALTPFGTVPGFPSSVPKETLNTEGLMDVLSVDFSRALKELAVILNDLKRLSALGDLPITYVDSRLRIHFPGCDADSVERLALELGLQRGVIGQDAGFDAFAGTDIALLFPFAPSKAVSECSFYEKPTNTRTYNARYLYDEPSSPEFEESLRSPEYSTQSADGEEGYEVMPNSPFLSSSSPSGYESLHSSELDDSGRCYEKSRVGRQEPLEYSGIEGIYRFIQEIDDARR